MEFSAKLIIALLMIEGGRSLQDAPARKLTSCSAPEGNISCKRAAAFKAFRVASCSGADTDGDFRASVMILHIMAVTFDAKGSRVARREEAKRSRKRKAGCRSCSKLFFDANASKMTEALILQKISKT